MLVFIFKNVPHLNTQIWMVMKLILLFIKFPIKKNWKKQIECNRCDHENCDEMKSTK